MKTNSGTTLAIAVGALLMSLLAFAPDAAAEVVYTPVNVFLSGNGSIKIDLNHDGITDFVLRSHSQVTACGNRGGLIGSTTITPTAGDGVVVSHLDFAALLTSGAQIDSSASFYKSKAVIAQFFLCEFGAYNVSGFLGLEFQIKGQTHYGWAEVSVAAQFGTTHGTMHTTLTGFAYETIPGQAIKTGQTSGNFDEASSIPESIHNAKHHRYKLFQMGTFGGPTSSIDRPGSPPFIPFNRIISRAGAVLGSGDTLIPDPYCFDGCLVNYAFRWQNGVQTNLGVLPQNPTLGDQTPCFDCAWSVFAFWIADNGFVAGQSPDNALDPLTGFPAPLAVLWKDGKIINLGTLGGNQSGAGAVNGRGEVVGAALNLTTDPFPFRAPYFDFFFFGNGTESHAFLWRSGTMQDLGTLGGPDSAAFLVNRKGQVAGTSDVDFNVNPVTGGPTVHPFLWEDGKMLDLVAGAPPEMFGGTFGIAAWLNERGQVLGTMNLTGDTTWHSFLWDKGVVMDLGTLGGINTTAQWLNSAGNVSGKSDVTSICTACAPDNQKQLHHPFLWKDGVMTDLGLLYSDTAGTAYSVNAKDQAVGVTVPCTKVNFDDSCDGPVYDSFLWENGSMVDLQTLLLPGSGITLSSCSACEVGAYNINDRGEITGQGVLSNGDSRVVLLIPCDENHAGIEDCDYSLVDAAAAPERPVYVPSAMPRTPQLERTNRYHIPGVLPPSR